MTTQLYTNNSQLKQDTSDLAAFSPPAHLPDEATLARLATALFAEQSPLNTTSTTGQHSELNVDAANITPPPHPPQAAEPLSALSGRAPNIAYQKSLNQEYPTQIPLYPDNPERRAIASAPIIGGANLPRPPLEPHFTSIGAHSHAIPQLDLNDAKPSHDAPFYFLNFAQTDQSTATAANTAVQHTAQQQPSATDATTLPQTAGYANPLNRPQQQEQQFYFLDHAHVDVAHHKTSIDPLATPLQRSGDGLRSFDVQAIRRDFPILQQRVHGHPLIWLDNAATTHKPQVVIDRIAHFYQYENSNIHRAAHELAARATDAYEHARQVVARFIGAPSVRDIIFVRGTTEGINLIAKSWGEQNIAAGDEIILSHLEHHANIVPWYQLSQKTGAKLRIIPVDDDGQIMVSALAQLINKRTKLIAITQVSNALGTITPIAEVIQLAHANGVRVLVDGAQSVSHLPTNVQALDADFFVFSGHKVFAPTGIGVVYAKAELLDSMPVWEGGGNMIQDVTFEQVIYQPAPNKFEAGTGNIADAVGLGAALEYVEAIGIDNIARYEHDLLQYGQYALRSVAGLRPIGTAKQKASVLSFTLDGFSTEQVGQALNQHGIAVRSGHHCAQPILRRFGVEQTVRPSLAFYNTTEEIDSMVAVLQQLTQIKQRRSIQLR
ncbi:family 2A encapsulin nanocompartment cargo protein cysteine desulfurase [Acinetobacter larvae]|uniref:cysteine desulfurase n=1 Tax=Acinetobacter larvae TaxID=1789224 RepID=A0A1B2LZL4_9GAMM|nr:family 2A encapsulin nanocompartment cargo protein cysteine desulfurase [Acinetobacter larvae]AOA58367.1 cysteine desulfurase [Acinetobacter larvae]